ncbi:MAG TPA: hypothetical protein VFW60_03495 [Rhodanobacteraceae bacterium]|nr:hypothetical protein [Rhodanobacteraceae bacterium]
MDGFWQRLRQRKLVQWALAYVAAAFAFIQVLDVIAQRFGWPDRVEKLIILALAVGFLVMLVLAWYHGEKGAQRIGGGELLIIALLLAIGGGALWAYTRAPATAAAKRVPSVAAAAAAPASAPAPFHPPADTLVVLPFTNLGGDPKQQYFSDGITEELTNTLGQNTGLRVIAWDTASKFRNSTQSATDIGRQLDVANVLTGKVLRQGNEVRVIVELVNATSGYQVWASHYDDNLKNIFGVQDKISASIADALKVKFAAARAVHTVNPQAYDLVQQARALMNKALSGAPLEKARSLLERAVALDPDYADAHAELAAAWWDLSAYTTISPKMILSKSRAEAHHALALEPNNVEALLVLAAADGIRGKYAEAAAGYRRVLELDPSNALAHLNYALLLPTRQAMAETQQAVRLDPDSTSAQNNLAVGYLNLGEYAKALPLSLTVMKMDPHSVGSAFSLAMNYALLHRHEDAVKAFDQVQPDTALGKALVAAGKLAYQSVLDPKLHAQALAAADSLHQRTNLDPDSLYNLFQVYLVLGEKSVALQLLDRSCAPVPFDCADFAVNPTYIPLRRDPRFEALEKKYDVIARLPASATPVSSSP